MDRSDDTLRMVFVSSTYEDLKDYRAATIEAIRRFGWLTVAMESLVSKDARPKEECLNLVTECDVYIGIFAHRYGHIPDGDELSITEQEYLCARETGLECLIFIVEDDYPWKKKWIDRDSAELSLLALKKRLRSDHIYTSFTTPENLAALVSASLAKYTRDFLTRELLEWSKKAKLPSAEQVPIVKVRVFRNPLVVTDVRCLVFNQSHFPTSVKTFVDATIGGQHYERPIPGHYRGESTWDLPAQDGFEGHFNLEAHVLLPAGWSYGDIKISGKKLEITVEYSALTQMGEWLDLGKLTYAFDFRREEWIVSP